MKNTRLTRCLFVVCVLCLFASIGCRRRPAPDAAASCPPAEVQFAVAPFTNPGADYQLLAGYVPEDAAVVSDGALARLDALLSEALAGECKVTVRPVSAVTKCIADTAAQSEMNRLGTFKYWQSVGKCVRAEYLIIPQIITLRERQGSAMGVEKPAKVNMSVFLMNVGTGGVMKYAHFEEEQHTLMDNILETKKFLERKGRWLTALELAREGMNKSIAELGL